MQRENLLLTETEVNTAVALEIHAEAEKNAIVIAEIKGKKDYAADEIGEELEKLLSPILLQHDLTNKKEYERLKNLFNDWYPDGYSGEDVSKCALVQQIVVNILPIYQKQQELVSVVSLFASKLNEAKKEYEKENKVEIQRQVKDSDFRRMFSDPQKIMEYTNDTEFTNGKRIWNKVLEKNQEFKTVYQNINMLAKNNVSLFKKAEKEMKENKEISEKTRMEIFNSLKPCYDEIFNHLKNQKNPPLTFADKTLKDDDIKYMAQNFMFAIIIKLPALAKYPKSFNESYEGKSTNELFRFLANNLDNENYNDKMINYLSNKNIRPNKYLLDIFEMQQIAQYISAYGERNVKEAVGNIRYNDKENFNNFLETEMLKKEQGEGGKNKYADKVIKLFNSILSPLEKNELKRNVEKKYIINKLEELSKNYKDKDKEGKGLSQGVNKKNSMIAADIDAVLRRIKDDPMGGDYYIKTSMKKDLQDIQSNNRTFTFFQKPNTLTDGLSDILSRLKKYPQEKELKPRLEINTK